MPTRVDRSGPRAHLTSDQALSLTIERQGLLHRAGGLDAVAAVERFGPLHATDHRTPYLSLLARLDGFSLADLDRAWLLERRLDRRAAMRGTLHLVPGPRLPDIVCAFGTFRPEEHRFLREAGIAADEAVRLRSAIKGILARDGPLDLGGLKRALPADLRERATTKTAVGPSVLAALVRWMTEAGLLAFVAKIDPRSGEQVSGWARAPHLYERFQNVFGRLPRCVQAEADARLARWYFEAHGPAATEDWAWWTGFSAPRARSAFEVVRGALVEIEVEGWPEQVFMPASAFEVPPQAAGGNGPIVRLLPYEDAGIKAYRATRRRFFNPDVAQRQHTSYGEVLPTVLLDGRVIGTWSHGVGGWASALEAAAGRPARDLSVELSTSIDRVAADRLEEELERVRAALLAVNSGGG